MTKEEAFRDINEIQDYYVDELIKRINSKNDVMKQINFTSPTGTGKTKMMSKLINKFPNYYFIITTLSKGQLNYQVRMNLEEDCINDNFEVYGTADFRINSILQANDIIKRIPNDKKCIWLRDEGHIATNRYDEVLLEKCYKVINFSATNKYDDIKCNFTSTMMLRTVKQDCGTPEDAIEKLLEIKKNHIMVKNYNPCAIFRCIKGDVNLHKKILTLCKQNKLKCIDLNDDSYIMKELCEDDNEYDVIINKMKLVEGIDIRRAHVVYMDSQPDNDVTTIQTIGRCRRNALLYRNDIDIFSPSNANLLKNTRECYAFYNVEKMNISTDENGELCYAFCDKISCESLKPHSRIYVNNGQLMNGLTVIELENLTGYFDIEIDKKTGFNIVKPINNNFYKKKVLSIPDNYIYLGERKVKINNNSSVHIFYNHLKKLNVNSIDKFRLQDYKLKWNTEYNNYEKIPCIPFYNLEPYEHKSNVKMSISEKVLDKYCNYCKKYLANDGKLILSKIKDGCIDLIFDKLRNRLQKEKTKIYTEKYLSIKLNELYQNFSHTRGYNKFCNSINEYNNSYYNHQTLLNIKYLCFQNKINDYYFDISSLSILEDIPILIKKFEIKDLDINKLALFAITNNENYSFMHSIISKLKNYEKDTNYISRFFILKNYKKQDVKISDVDKYFKIDFEEYLNRINTIYLFRNSYDLINIIKEQFSLDLVSLRNNVVPRVTIDYSSLFEELNPVEREMIETGQIKGHISSLNYYSFNYNHIPIEELDNYVSKPFKKIINDKESAIIGTDIMRQYKTYGKYNDLINSYWGESSSVTSKIGKNTKLNKYITNKYGEYITKVTPQLFSGKNSFDFDKKCNSVLGICVEYYSKYLIYGPEYLYDYISALSYDKNNNKIKDAVIVRACLLKYKTQMVMTFGEEAAKRITTISIDQLIKEKYSEFVKTVIMLGQKTAKYVKKTLYPNAEPQNNISPILSIEHISALADYITEDTILDIKVTNNITENHIRQVLAYHYLSTKRSDLHINRVIVYDATSGKDVIINL